MENIIGITYIKIFVSHFANRKFFRYDTSIYSSSMASMRRQWLSGKLLISVDSSHTLCARLYLQRDQTMRAIFKNLLYL